MKGITNDTMTNKPTTIANRPHRPYTIVDYDPNWAIEFQKRKEITESVLGDQVIAVHHIGSTSVPGMVAKPQLDILVVVKNLDSVKEKYEAMKASGYEPKGNYTGIGEEYFSEDDNGGKRLSGIHVVPEGHPQIEKLLVFRDYLTANKEDRDLYISLKKELFAKHADDYREYGVGKNDLIKEIAQRAAQWAVERAL